MKKPSACVVLVTTPSMKVARSIARTLVDERLIACANILPSVRSIYAWKGEIVDGTEVMLVLKTQSRRFEALRARVVELHPYSVPEVIQLPVTAGHTPYLSWISDSVRPRRARAAVRRAGRS